jgi:hypothetical protein
MQGVSDLLTKAAIIVADQHIPQQFSRDLCGGNVALCIGGHARALLSLDI